MCMSAKRVLFVVYELPPLGGGVATAANHLLKEFAKEPDLIIDVITSSLKNTWEEEKFSKNITIYKVPIGKKPPEKYQKQTPLEMLRFTIFSGLKVYSLLKKHQYQKAHYFGYPGGLNGLIFKKKVPYIVSLRGVDVPGYNQKFGWYYRIYRPLSKLIWQQADKVVANSQWLASLARKTLEREILIIPNGVDTEKFRPIPEKDKFKMFTITAGGTVMGPKKGLEYLVEGFALFHKQYPESRLLLFGTGELESKLKQMAKDLGIETAVEFTGQVNHDELAKMLPKCHVMCLPSLAEGMSNAVLEAAACGLPLILTDVGGIRELSNTDFVIVRRKSALEIANAISSIFVRSNRSKNNFKIQTWKEVSYQYREMYGSIIFN